MHGKGRQEDKNCCLRFVCVCVCATFNIPQEGEIILDTDTDKRENVGRGMNNHRGRAAYGWDKFMVADDIMQLGVRGED